jgi:hypothetical protein
MSFRRARRNGGQVPGPRSADRYLFDGNVESRGCPSRDGVPLQPQPTQRRYLPRQMRIDPCRLTADLRSGVPHTAAGPVGERLLSLSRDGKMYIVDLKISPPAEGAFSGRRGEPPCRCGRSEVRRDHPLIEAVVTEAA